MDLDSTEWGEFFIEDIAEILSGRDIYESERIKGDTPYISATSENNGIGHFVGNDNKTLEKKCLSVNRNGSIGYSFYHPYYALYSNDCRKLRLENNSKYVGLFISRLITHQKDKYNYSYKMGTARLKRQKIMLPITPKGKPNYAFMEAYMRKKEAKKKEKYTRYVQKKLDSLKDFKKVKALDEKEWRDFFLNNIFNEIKRGKRLKKADHKFGEMPYVSSTGSNNGVDSFIGNKEDVRIFNNCLSIANSGSVGSCFYQPFKFVASDHVTKLKNNNFNRHIYQFLATLLTRLDEKYSYNREINDKRMKREKIMLPVNGSQKPDYDYMENYMKQLEYKRLVQYLEEKGLTETV